MWGQVLLLPCPPDEFPVNMRIASPAPCLCLNSAGGAPGGGLGCTAPGAELGRLLGSLRTLCSCWPRFLINGTCAPPAVRGPSLRTDQREKPGSVFATEQDKQYRSPASFSPKPARYVRPRAVFPLFLGPPGLPPWLFPFLAKPPGWAARRRQQLQPESPLYPVPDKDAPLDLCPAGMRSSPTANWRGWSRGVGLVSGAETFLPTAVPAPTGPPRRPGSCQPTLLGTCFLPGTEPTPCYPPSGTAPLSGKSFLVLFEEQSCSFLPSVMRKHSVEFGIAASRNPGCL